MSNRPLFGGVEAGGTKFICGVGSGGGELIARYEIETTTPSETLQQAIGFFNKQPPLQSIGIGSFGPVEINKHSPKFGTILQTPKPGWSGAPIYKEIRQALGVTVKLVTDTDVAAIGEYHHGIGLHIENFVYLTVGTGIGGSILVNGKLVHGMSHPEMGHIQIPILNKQNVEGSCPYHKNCLEGLASGKAMEKQYGKKAALLDDEDAWALEAHYLAHGIANILLITQPERIIIGGSVMKKQGLIERVRELVPTAINGYIELPPPQDFLVKASSDSIGVLGAIKLASYQ